MVLDNMKNKTVIIIGATSGLGAAVASRLDRRAERTIATGRDAESLKALEADASNEGVITRHLDIDSDESIEEFSEYVNQMDCKEIVLICNAGIWLEGDTAGEDLAKIQHVVQTNLIGHMKLVSSLLPAMASLKNGHIIFVNSVAGIDHNPGNSFYSASKFGLYGFAKALQSEVVGDNIKVTSFHPGGMNTNLFKKSGLDYSDEEWMMNTGDIADILVSTIDQPHNVLVDQVSIRTFPQNIMVYGDIG